MRVRLFESTNTGFRKDHQPSRLDVPSVVTRKQFDKILYKTINDPTSIGPDGIIDLNHLSSYTAELSDFSDMFIPYKDLSLNFDVSKWDVSIGEDFDRMFAGCYKFECDLSDWDVSHAGSMTEMFSYCESFTGKGLENWDVGGVESFRMMFEGATSLKADLSKWDTSAGQDFDKMFYGALDDDVGEYLMDKWNLHSRSAFWGVTVHDFI